MCSSEKITLRELSRNEKGYSATIIKEDGTSFQALIFNNEQGLFAKTSNAILPLRGGGNAKCELHEGDTFEIMEAIV